MTVRRTKLDVEQYDLGSLRLYREDLQAIAMAASEAGKLAITCDGFEATSPDDFGDALPEKLSRVTIKAANPDRPSAVEIRLAPREATVLLTEPDTLLAGIVSRVRLICEPRRRRMISALLRVGTGSAGLFVVTGVLLGSGAGFVVAGTVAHPTGGVKAALFVSVGVLAVLSIGFGIWFANRPWVEMINAPRADRPTYWQRTRDIWVVGVITALLGAVVGYLLGKYT